MPSKRHATVWPAKDHTKAKIAILEDYLIRWFQILGSTKAGQDLVYVDGFAGPGEYTNYSKGSPVAALVAACKALASTAITWRAGDLHCVFIEADPKRFSHLDERLGPFKNITPFKNSQKLKIQTLNATFSEGVSQLKMQLPKSFNGPHPLLVFIDPFGAKGVGFSNVVEILDTPCSEVLFNLDADGIDRIYRDLNSPKHLSLMDEIFGEGLWQGKLSSTATPSQRYRQVLDLYVHNLRLKTNVKYAFPFEMRKSDDKLDYFLVFLSHHPLGLRKMKEVMKRIDQTGDYHFSDAGVGQMKMFRFDNPEDYAPKLFQAFAGQKVGYSEVDDFALNETPFIEPKGMLTVLEKENRISVESSSGKRRRFTFNPDKIKSITFTEGDQQWLQFHL